MNLIANYDGFELDPAVSDAYFSTIAYLESRYYATASRYTTSAFMRLKLGVSLKSRDLAPHGIEVAEAPIGGSPFALNGTPVTLRVPARKLPSWRAVDGVADAVPRSPVVSTEADETITLVPYAAAKLRITAFPTVKS